MLSIEQLELKTAYFEMKEAEAKFANVFQRLRPSYSFPITLRRENARWVCLLETDPDILNCPIAYGNSPAQAMLNFDLLWNGAGIEIKPPDDEEEEF